MGAKYLITALAIVAVSATASNALTINNGDEVDYVVEVVEGVGDAGVKWIDLSAGKALQDICNSGCTITLDNGTSQLFSGDESVTIEDGQFVLAQ